MYDTQRDATFTARLRRLIDLDRALQNIGVPGLLERDDDELARFEAHLESAERRRQGGAARAVPQGAAHGLRLLRGGLLREEGERHGQP